MNRVGLSIKDAGKLQVSEQVIYLPEPTEKRIVVDSISDAVNFPKYEGDIKELDPIQDAVNLPKYDGDLREDAEAIRETVKEFTGRDDKKKAMLLIGGSLIALFLLTKKKKK